MSYQATRTKDGRRKAKARQGKARQGLRRGGVKGLAYLFAVEGWNTVAQQAEAVFDVVATFALQGVVVCSFVRLGQLLTG